MITIAMAEVPIRKISLALIFAPIPLISSVYAKLYFPLCEVLINNIIRQKVPSDDAS